MTSSQENGFPHFRPGTIGVRARAYDFNVRFFSPGCYFLGVSCDFLFPGRAALSITPPDWYLQSRAQLAVLPGLVVYVISKAYLLFRLPHLLFDNFRHLYEPIPFLGGFIEPLRKCAMGLSDQSLFLLLAEPLCQPHHLVGIIQSCVWLSCFIGYFSPGLITVFPLEGWLTASASTSPFFRA